MRFDNEASNNFVPAENCVFNDSSKRSNRLNVTARILAASALTLASTDCMSKLGSKAAPVERTAVSSHWAEPGKCEEQYNLPARAIALPPLLKDHLADTPPMGVNPYNHFGNTMDETQAHQLIDAMHAYCLYDAGYDFFNLDDKWNLPIRDASGNLQVDKVHFPNGIRALSDYAHSQGIYFGIYASVGEKTCEQEAGSSGHEEQDVQQFADWGVDFIKVDWCPPGNNYSHNGAMALARKWRQAIDKTGRPMVLSISNGGGGEPWQWPDDVGINMYRVGPDIRPKWANADDKGSITEVIDRSHMQEAAVGVHHGKWADPDMIEVGNPGLSDIEAQAHMGMWAMLSAPLLAGGDIRYMTKATQATYVNPEVIAIDQDPAGLPAKKISLGEQTDHQIWRKALQDPKTEALAFLNESDKPAQMSVNLLDLNLPGPRQIRDLWQHTETTQTGIISENVPAHGVVILKISAK